MSIGTLFFLIVIGGSLFAMFAMHRGGHGMGMGCGGSHGPADDHRSAGMGHTDGVAMIDDGDPGGEPGSTVHTGKHRGGC